MNPITINLTFADGTTATAVASAPDFVAFETRFDKSVQSFASDVRLEHMLFIAWNASKRKGETKLEFDEWLETVENIEVEEAKK